MIWKIKPKNNWICFVCPVRIVEYLDCEDKNEGEYDSTSEVGYIEGGSYGIIIRRNRCRKISNYEVVANCK